MPTIEISSFEKKPIIENHGDITKIIPPKTAIAGPERVFVLLRLPAILNYTCPESPFFI